MKLIRLNRSDAKKGRKGKRLHPKKRSLDYVEWRQDEAEAEDARDLVAEEKEMKELGWRFI